MPLSQLTLLTLGGVIAAVGLALFMDMGRRPWRQRLAIRGGGFAIFCFGAFIFASQVP